MSHLTILQTSLSKFQKKKTPEKRLSQLSTKKQIFNESAPFYEDKLQQSGHQQKLRYNPLNTKIHNKHNHKRNMIWFNPHFSKNVSTKLGKYFLNLRHSHFLQNHRLRKFSQSCTKSMKTIINNHNKNILGTKPLINT